MWSIIIPKCILECVHSLHLKIMKKRKGGPLAPICEFPFFAIKYFFFDLSNLIFGMLSQFHVEWRSRILISMIFENFEISIFLITFSHFSFFSQTGGEVAGYIF